MDKASVMIDKNRKKLWMCIRSYKCSVRTCTAYESFAKPFKKLCHHGPPVECRAAGRCLAVPIEVVFQADGAGVDAVSRKDK